MHPRLSPVVAAQAATHLAEHDAVLNPIIASAGLCDIAPHRNYYHALVREIIGQQLSVKAAAAILKRFLDLFGGKYPSPEQMLQHSVEELRAAGLSRAKATYVRDIAQHVLDGKLNFDGLDKLSDDQIIVRLTDVKGVGLWTAHMFLMFCMGRPDVLAVGDLGIKNGIQKLYGLDHSPQPAEMEALADQNGWHPYATVACWYVWFSLDNKPV